VAFKPVKVLKRRIVSSVPSLALQWKLADDAATMDVPTLLREPFEAVVPESFVEAAYPELLSEFVAASKPQKKKKAAQRTTKKIQKENETPQENATQKPITTYFNQRRKSLPKRAPLQQHQHQSKQATMSDDDLFDVSEDDVSDLSLIIDEIVDKKGRSCQPSAAESRLPNKRDVRAAFATSTPGVIERSKPRFLHLQEAMVGRKEEGDPAEATPEKDLDFSIEDSFDRMCL